MKKSSDIFEQFGLVGGLFLFALALLPFTLFALTIIAIFHLIF